MPSLKLTPTEHRWLRKAIDTQLKADRAYLKAYEKKDFDRKALRVSTLTETYRREVALGNVLLERLNELTPKTKTRKIKARTSSL